MAAKKKMPKLRHPNMLAVMRESKVAMIHPTYGTIGLTLSEFRELLTQTEIKGRSFRSAAEVDAAYFPKAEPRQGVEQFKKGGG